MLKDGYIYEDTGARFERILLPIVIDPSTPIAGAHGSRWVTETHALSSYPIRVAQDPATCGGDCPDVMSGSVTFSPALTQSLSGAFLYAEIPDEQKGSPIAVHHRVRDLSRQAHTWGTEPPAVRTSQIVQGAAITLLNVPLDERFRQTLRVYDLEAREYDVSVTFLDPESGNYLSDRTLRLTGARIGTFGRAITPSYAELQSFITTVPQLAGRTRVTLLLTPASKLARLWAFTSITNNETQHVTTITPQ